MAADEDAPPQLELGLGLAPALGAPAPAAANGQLTAATGPAASRNMAARSQPRTPLQRMGGWLEWAGWARRAGGRGPAS